MLRQIATGRPTRLQSRFRLTSNMILNLLRQEDMKVEVSEAQTRGQSQ